ncbi:hypothetical protein DFH27DRAFT_391806 [Peziza echinospora]|nr:hypothetical protein DFH27DRAFT_391806 [Peziza echinospora]
MPHHRQILPFLYPALFRPSRTISTSPAIRTAVVGVGVRSFTHQASYEKVRRRAIGSKLGVGELTVASGYGGRSGGGYSHRSQLHLRARHGTAVEPTSLQSPPKPDSNKADGQEEQKEAGQESKKDTTSPLIEGEIKSTKPSTTTLTPIGSSAAPQSPPVPSTLPTPPPTPTEASPLEPQKPPQSASITSATNHLNSILSTTATSPPLFGQPRLQSHYFDTYSLVRRLNNAGFPPAQSRALMHLLHSLLHQNLLQSQNVLLSRSTLENDSYLFKAACGELRNEIQLLRASQLDKMRVERSEIQMKFEALNQRFLEDLMICKDELKSMLNDRKMVTSAEQREVVNKIQELNYKITVHLVSDIKSEVEKLRWTTTRRALIAIAILAIFIVCMIKLQQNIQRQAKEKKAAELAAAVAAESHPPPPSGEQVVSQEYVQAK